MSCKARVWGNGDMEECLEPTPKGYSLCPRHRQHRLEYLREKLRVAKAESEKVLAELSELEREGDLPP